MLNEYQKNEITRFIHNSFPDLKIIDISFVDYRQLYRSSVSYLKVYTSSKEFQLVIKIRSGEHALTQTIEEHNKYKIIEQFLEGKSFKPVITLGYIETLPALVTYKLDGCKLSDCFIRADEESLINWISRCGEFLGFYHNNHRLDKDNSYNLSPRIISYLDSVGLAGEILNKLQMDRYCYVYSDFTLSNSFLVNNDKLSYLDPPAYNVARLIHYDLAKFRHSLLLNVIKRFFITLKYQPSLFNKLYYKFLRSYEAATGIELTNLDHYIINIKAILRLEDFLNINLLMEDRKYGVKILSKLTRYPINFSVLMALKIRMLFWTKVSDS